MSWVSVVRVKSNETGQRIEGNCTENILIPFEEAFQLFLPNRKPLFIDKFPHVNIKGFGYSIL